MDTQKVDWFVFTFLSGFIPILTRIIMWGTVTDSAASIVHPSDFIALGFNFGFASLYRISQVSTYYSSWITMKFGTFIMLGALYLTLLIIIQMDEFKPGIIDISIIKNYAMILSCVSISLSYFTFNEASALQDRS